MELEKLPDVFLPPTPTTTTSPATSAPLSFPREMDIHDIVRSCGLGELHWLETRRADCLIWEGLAAGIEIPAGKGPRGQISHWFILHRASLSESHRKGSIIMQSLCARTGQFGKLS